MSTSSVTYPSDREIHARAAASFPTMIKRGPCRIEVIDWPYDCIARDEHPTDTCYQCRTHGGWWHESA